MIKMDLILRVLVSYVKKNRTAILFFSIVVIIFYVIFYLYSIPFYAISYALVLSIVFAVMFFVFDFIKYYKKHKQLKELMNTINVSIDKLTNSEDVIEEDYINLVKELFYETKKLNSQMDINRTDMMDYYTLWVHQIKTPISAMKLLLEEETVRADKLSLELFKIERYVEMVLQYLRIESISSDLRLESYSLNDIVKQAVKKYATLFIHKKIRLELKEIDIKVVTDEKWITFVIEQLLSNALKYTNEGVISIYLDDEKDNILVIEDTGIGIQEEDLPRVFEKGFTGYNGRTDKKSTGLGLYLCKQILTKLSHEITITSKVGEGTKVYIET